MAYAHTTRAAHGSIAEQIGALVERLKTSLVQRAIYRKTIQELNALSNRDLADLGIGRSQIRRVALEAAYGE